jgi:hypothetical protein
MEMSNSQAHVRRPGTISVSETEVPETRPVEPELPPEEEPEPETLSPRCANRRRSQSPPRVGGPGGADVDR